MSREPDRSRLDVEICEIVDESRLQVVLDLVDCDLMANIGDLDVGEVLLGFIDCLVDTLVVFDTIAEVFGRFFWILSGTFQRESMNKRYVAYPT